MSQSLTTGSRNGNTLVEMLVALSLLAIIASVVTPALRRVPVPDPNDPMTIIAESLVVVHNTGRRITLEFLIDGQPAVATLEPDGSIVADSALNIERLTGRRVNGR